MTRVRATPAKPHLDRAHRAVATVLLVVEGEHVAQLERLRRAIDHAADLAGLRYVGLTRGDERRLAKTRAVLDARQAKRDAKTTARATAKAEREAARHARTEARMAAKLERARLKLEREDARITKALARANKKRRRQLEKEREALEFERERLKEAERLRRDTEDWDPSQPYTGHIDPWGYEIEPCTGKTYRDHRGPFTWKETTQMLSFAQDSKGRPSARRVRNLMSRNKRDTWGLELASCAAGMHGHLERGRAAEEAERAEHARWAAEAGPLEDHDELEEAPF